LQFFSILNLLFFKDINHQLSQHKQRLLYRSQDNILLEPMVNW